MSDAAADQGWLPPAELERLRAELGDTEFPVDEATGLDQVAETRRVLERARKDKL